jgi:polygalacturonase
MHGIHVSDCEIISCTNAFKIGTETTFGISDVLVENCRFYMTDLYPGSVSGISIESADGSAVENITVRNVEMSRCTCPIFIRLCNRNRAALVNEQSASAVEFGVKAVSGGETDRNRFDMKGRLDNILIENVKARDIELPVIVAGFRQKGKTVRVKNVTLKDIELEYRNAREVYDRRLFIPEYSKEYPECWRFRNLPAYALWARHAENLVTENFTCTPAPNTWKEEKILIDVI